jgi:hypothetical protein
LIRKVCPFSDIMADQNTTIAQLPAGYATLAGVIYAVAATSPKVWSYIAWTRMSAIFMKRAQRVDTIKTRQSSNTSPHQLAELQAGLSETVIQQLRQLRLPDSSVVAKHIAVMHVICSNAQNDSFSTGREDDININDPEAQRHLRARSVDGSGNEPPPMSSAQFPPIDVDIHGLRTPISTTTVTLTVDEVRQGATKVVDLTDAFMSMCLKQANTDQFSRRVHAQAAAPFKAVVIELVYKAIEVLNPELTWKSTRSLLRKRRKHCALGDIVAMIVNCDHQTRSSVRRFSMQSQIS